MEVTEGEVVQDLFVSSEDSAEWHRQACARFNGCKFDHKQFLMPCTDHRHIFQLETRLNSREKTEFKMGKQYSKENHKCIDKDDDSNHEDDQEDIQPIFIGGTATHSNSNNSKKEVLVMGGWESVAGLQNVIQCMKEAVVLPLLYPEFFQRPAITPPTGLLLHGYPGTGKTHVVRALVASCARADCLGNDSEKHLTKLFQVAKECQPSIIFFDEMDGLAPCRTSQQDHTHNSVVSTLLALLDGLKSRSSVAVIGATNRPNAIDPALRRPGRFDREIYFPLPSLEDRISILSLYTQKWPKTLDSYQHLLHWIAKNTSGFAGADLQPLCTQTAINALKKATCDPHPTQLPVVVVEDKDWLEALSTCPPLCSRREALAASNETASSPLPFHLIPCLIRPLSILLVLLYMEESIYLPKTLLKAATIVKRVIDSSLERKKMVSTKWWFHLDDFIQDS
uniref:AAA+ ATPase domain-containing protein n=1 Tax=Cucumis sativus TaxID=3659 RepID=A0A0A0L8H0_CUCSA